MWNKNKTEQVISTKYEVNKVINLFAEMSRIMSARMYSRDRKISMTIFFICSLRRRQAIISAVREAALRAIKAGRTIVGNSEKISAALNDAVKDIRAVIAEGLIDVGGAISDVGDSVSKAGQVLNQAKTAADNIDLGLGDTATEVSNARGPQRRRQNKLKRC